MYPPQTTHEPSGAVRYTTKSEGHAFAAPVKDVRFTKTDCAATSNVALVVADWLPLKEAPMVMSPEHWAEPRTLNPMQRSRIGRIRTDGAGKVRQNMVVRVQ